MGFLLREPTSASGRGPITLLHRTSLPVTLSSSLYELSCHPRSWEELWQDGRPATIAGEAARMPSPEDQLAHVLGRASFSPTRVTLQWACDAWKIAARAPTLDADAFVAAAGQSAIVLAASTMLQYLSALGATISSGLLDAAQRRASSATRFERDLALNGLRLGTRSGLSGVLQRMPERRIRLALLWWTVFPSADYVRWAHQPRHSAFIPARYISRALSGMVSMARAR